MFSSSNKIIKTTPIINQKYNNQVLDYKPQNENLLFDFNSETLPILSREAYGEAGSHSFTPEEIQKIIQDNPIEEKIIETDNENWGNVEIPEEYRKILEESKTIIPIEIDYRDYRKNPEKYDINGKPTIWVTNYEQINNEPISNKNITRVNSELGINGEIDEAVFQGNTGDCWFLSGLEALNSTEIGKQIIRNSIIPNEDGTVTVKFAGVGKSYTITAEEIKAHDTDDNTHDSYSNGDNDVLALELAMEKYRKENPSGFYESNTLSSGAGIDCWEVLAPNYKTDLYHTGAGTAELPNVENRIRTTLQNLLGNKNTVMAFSLDKVTQAKLINGNTYVYNGGNHLFSVTDVSEKEVTFKDPADNTKSYTLTWDEFIKLKPDRICSADLTGS